MTDRRLRLIPPDDDGPGPDSPPPAEPPGPSSATDPYEDPPPTDGEALENRVMLDRLGRNLAYIAAPGDAIAAIVRDASEEQLLVAVFNVDALPELVNLLLREGG